MQLYVHVPPGSGFIYERKVSALGGLPLGTNGKGLVFALQGGIDSPVAAFLMAKPRHVYRGRFTFIPYPYTSERAWER